MESKNQKKDVSVMTRAELVTELTELRTNFEGLHQQALQVVAQRNQLANALENKRVELLFRVIENKSHFTEEAASIAAEEITTALGLTRAPEENPGEGTEQHKED